MPTKNMTKPDFKQYLMDYEEFEKSGSETSNYEAPYSAIVPPPKDKIWNYVKAATLQGPRWGFKFKEQEWDNQERGKRDEDPGDKPIEDGSASKA